MSKKIFYLILLLILFFTSSGVVFGQIDKLNKEIDELRKKISEAQATERTLSAEIKVMDQNIRLTELEIAETEQEIEKLAGEIEDLTNRIDKLEMTLSRLSGLLINRIVTSYKVNRVSYLPLLFSGNGLTDFLNRVKYITTAQAHDRQVMETVQSSKVDYSEKRDLREEKKQQQEELQLQLEKQKTSLAKQKAQKQAVLTQTKNDEATYQKLLQQALAEKQALEAALITGQQVGPVKTGDEIALVGNTGYPACSTGAHLHFEVRENNTWVNPANYLKNKSVIDDQNGSGGNTNLGSGSWEWPLSDPIRITQFYGQTPYSWRYSYSGGIHTGIDMVSNSSEVIKAPADGILYSSSQNCGGSSIIKIKYIDHGGGKISFYLHVK